MKKRREESERRKREEEEELKKNAAARKLQDQRIKGYKHDYYINPAYTNYTENTTRYKTEQELGLEQVMVQEKQENGEVIGENWVKTEHGWERGYDPQKTYKGRASPM